ncbi:MAG TPA: hypothetical protein VG297_06805 [Bryobacteraceae bacterium]|jgi:hypothetical protein|nr:hypothetical protein [Bryobacteraceae bacterium]
MGVGRVAGVAIAVLLLTDENYAQQPTPNDAHENPVIQNSPEGKKEPPDTPNKSTPRPKETKPLKATSPPESPSSPAPPSPVLNTDDAILGTWKLVPEKSKFNPGPPPRSEIRTYVKTPDGIQATIKTTAADGTTRSITYPWQVDGKEHPIAGSKLLNSILLSKVDNLTSEATIKHGDMVIATEHRQLAPDGQTMSIEVKDLSSADKPISSSAVYQKLPPGP